VTTKIYYSLTKTFATLSALTVLGLPLWIFGNIYEDEILVHIAIRGNSAQLLWYPKLLPGLKDLRLGIPEEVGAEQTNITK
jgi:hypothetical protein